MRKLILLVVALALLAAACDGKEEPPASKQEQDKQTDNYSQQTETQPARGMGYSPTRESLNKWADTWEEQGKLSYIYLFDSESNLVGYYIFEGLPVSYCASLTPPDKAETVDGLDAPDPAVVRTAPSIDGVYYGAANCQQLFGFDAISGAYLEFTGGGSFNYLLSDQPMTNIHTKPLGDATIEGVKK